MQVIQGLNAEMVTGKEEPRRTPTQVAYTECEHAVKLLQAFPTFVFIKVNNDFGVGARTKNVAPPLKVRTEFGRIVDLTVIGDPQRSIFVGHGHMPSWRKVDDRESCAAESEARAIGRHVVPYTAVVRASMALKHIHALKIVEFSPVCCPANATHTEPFVDRSI
jgi:hypothetical protein